MRLFKPIWLAAFLLGFHPVLPVAAAEPDVIYVPTPEPVVEEMLQLAEVSGDDVVYDLGSGDGRIVITAAKRYGAKGVGIDIDPSRIAEARENAREAEVAGQVSFILGDLFETDLRDATVVTLYLLPSLNRRLIPKLYSELEPGTPVVSHDFDMGDWRPNQTVHVEDTEVYLWIIPAEVSGRWLVNFGTGTEEPMEMILDQQYQDVIGGVLSGGGEALIGAGTLEGKQIQFDAALWLDGAYRLVTFRGQVEGDVMEGQVDENGGEFSSQWTARRIEARKAIATRQ